MDITFEQVAELLPERTYLVYIDYRDNLDDKLEVIQKCISKVSFTPLDEELWEIFTEAQICEIDNLLRELKIRLCGKYGLEGKEGQDIIERYRDDLEQIIYDRDASTPMNDLLRNTSDLVLFYDIGVYIDEPYYEDRGEQLVQLKEALQITGDKYDEILDALLDNASYGGNLVIYFTYDVKAIIEISINKKNNYVEFKNPHVAIINMDNGSGYDVQLKDYIIDIPFNHKNLFIDKTLHYNYTYEVCGMSSDWCEDTDITFSHKDEETTLPTSSINEDIVLQEQYERTFKEGKCTYGDTDIRRHRHIVYVNDFPCGNKCTSCGQFWVD